MTPSNVSVQEGSLSTINEKLIILVAGIGMFLSTLDTGIINVALPFLEKELNSTVTTTAWSVTAYLMTLSGTIIIFGKLSDRFGRLKITSSGLVIFMLSSMLCGISQEMWQLIFFRALQGIGAAMLQSTSAALITTLIHPDKQNSALGTLGVMIGLGPILGPTVGGFLISLGGWRWIFWINIPLCIIGLWASYKLYKKVTEPTQKIQLDVWGNLLFASSAFVFIWGLSKLPSQGLLNKSTLGTIILTVVLLGLFLLRESKTKYPIIQLSILRNCAFTIPILATIGFGTGSAIIFIIPPYFLEKVTQLAPWMVGLVSLSAPLGLVILSKVSGRFINQLGNTCLMMIGLGIMILSFIGLSFIQVHWSPYILALLLFVYGVGGGIFQPPNIGAVMKVVSKDQQGTISAIQRMVQNIAIAFGTSVAALFMSLSAGQGKHGLIESFRYSWFVGGGLLLFNLLLFFIYPRKFKSRS